MTRETAPDLRRLLAALRRECPPLLPVRVRRVRGLARRAECEGICGLLEEGGRNVGFYIELDASLAGPMLTKAALHEWAHALSYTTEHPGFPEHGPEFRLALRRIRRALRPARRA